jgi:DNA-binding MarR family transcriptional regulator
MSRPELPRLGRKPLIALVERANRALQTDMVRRAHADGHTEVKMAHNSVFGTLYADGARAADMAARAGITRQSMGEVIRDMVAHDLLEMRPDPDDRRAKVVGYSEHGVEVASDGRRHLIELERRLAEEFGEREYDIARDVLERLVDVLDRFAAEGAQPADTRTRRA